MLKSTIKDWLGRAGWSLHRKDSIERLLRELERARSAAPGLPLNTAELPAAVPHSAEPAAVDGRLSAEFQKVRNALDWYEARKPFFMTTEDYGAADKQRHIVDTLKDFGTCDFADLACWIFASSLNNHRVIHQRIDEGAALWRATKISAGPILEIGRAAGGSTTTLLGASGNRPVISIDRDPLPCEITERVFNRPDVKCRLTLHTQSSREAIPETEFGMMFIDGDHSYEGVCHDIAMFWNNLRSFDGRPALAVFHDAAKNPITFVEAVKRACDELIAEPGVARVVEAWGSMLVVEKLADIDRDRWFAKEDKKFWRRYGVSQGTTLPPTRIRGRLAPDRPPPVKGVRNVLGDDNLDHRAWVKTAVELARVFDENDNPVRFVKECAESGLHGISKTAKVGLSCFGLTAFVRPVRLGALRLSISDDHNRPLAAVDFHLGNDSHIENPQNWGASDILDVAFLYGNGFFRCELSVATQRAVPSVTVAVNTLGPDGALEHQGDSERGFLMNLASLREILPCT